MKIDTQSQSPFFEKLSMSDVTEYQNKLRQVRRPLFLVERGEGTELLNPSDIKSGSDIPEGMILSCDIESLGDKNFCRDHGLRYAYVGGSMAKGISSVAMVKALGQQGMLGFFGSAGLTMEQVEDAADQLQHGAEKIPFGFNLIHSPSEPELEKALVEFYLRRGIRLIEASAFLALTLPVIRYRTAGIHRDAEGRVVAPNKIIAKISREEIAARFMAPPPGKFLKQLVADGNLTPEQAQMAEEIPVAQDITVEADSGGHTDNRPALALFPTIVAQMEELQNKYNYSVNLRVGLGGGIATPASALAAYAMGAAYLVTGTVNQACIESGTCDEVRKMLAETRQADITMAPSGDMFEMGVKVQVVKRGTMFSIRAHKLYELYKAYDSIDALPSDDREKLEKTFFRTPLTTIWEQTRQYFAVRDPRQIEKAEADPKYKMALVFRWYLGQTPVWANRGDASRKIDYQIWCGPAMGAFNEWARGSFLENREQRKVVTVAYNILYGAALMQRTSQLKQQVNNVKLDPDFFAPMSIDQIKEFLS